MLSAPGNVPSSQHSTPSLPQGMQSPPMDPLPRALCGSQLPPKATLGISPAPVFPCTSLPRPAPLCSRLSPGLQAAALPPAEALSTASSEQAAPQLPMLKPQRRSSGSGSPRAPSSRCAAGSCRCAGAGAVPGAAPGRAPTQLPGRVTGTQGKRNPLVNTHIQPADPEM